MQDLLPLPGLGQSTRLLGRSFKDGGNSGGTGAAQPGDPLLRSRLEALMQRAGIGPEVLSPEMLALLQQWLAAGNVLPPSSPPGETAGQMMPSTMGTAGAPGTAALLASLVAPYLGGAHGGQQPQSGPDGRQGEVALTEMADPLSRAIGEILGGEADQADLEGFLSRLKEERGLLAGLQQAPSPAVSPPGESGTLKSALLSMTVPQNVGAAGWDKSLGERLIWMVKGDIQRAELKLTPPNLGPLEVRLTVNDDKASVSFVSHHAAVRDAIEAALPRLREMLAQDALQLVRADVGGGQTDQRQASGDTAGEGGARFAAGDFSTTAGSGGAEEGGDPPAPVLAGSGLLDLFA